MGIHSPIHSRLVPRCVCLCVCVWVCVCVFVRKHVHVCMAIMGIHPRLVLTQLAPFLDWCVCVIHTVCTDDAPLLSKRVLLPAARYQTLCSVVHVWTYCSLMGRWRCVVCLNTLFIAGRPSLDPLFPAMCRGLARVHVTALCRWLARVHVTALCRWLVRVHVSLGCMCRDGQKHM